MTLTLTRQFMCTWETDSIRRTPTGLSPSAAERMWFGSPDWVLGASSALWWPFWLIAPIRLYLRVLVPFFYNTQLEFNIYIIYPDGLPIGPPVPWFLNSPLWFTWFIPILNLWCLRDTSLVSSASGSPCWICDAQMWCIVLACCPVWCWVDPLVFWQLYLTSWHTLCLPHCSIHALFNTIWFTRRDLWSVTHPGLPSWSCDASLLFTRF